MSEEEALNLLKRIINNWSWRIQGAEDPAEVMVSAICLYGGDSTCMVLSHYGKDRLREMVKQVLQVDNDTP